MKREAMVAAVDGESRWDVLVIGGGATGLGTALDAAARGYRTLLLERGDFGQGTSSRSTKLVHGGVRYMQQGHLRQVREALAERRLWFRNAPHLVREQAFLVPCYARWQRPYYGAGLRLYDGLSGGLGLAPSRRLDGPQALARVPNLETRRLRGGVVYHDGQFDDARAAVALARTAADHGATLLTRARVDGLLKDSGRVCGARFTDLESGREREVRSRVLINATGIFSDAVRRLDEPSAPRQIVPSQGAHAVLAADVLQGDTAILVPRTEDRRVLFAIPWSGRTLVGTTDTDRDEPVLEPRPLPEEVDYLLRTVARYLARDPVSADVRSLFAGQRPLVRRRHDGRRASGLRRAHVVQVSDTGLVTVTGGKWTTYRRMAADAVDTAAGVGGLRRQPSPTAQLPLRGWLEPAHPVLARNDHRRAYGSDLDDLEALEALADTTDPAHGNLGEPLQAGLPYSRAEIVWAARHEMARTVEDVLARRTRALLLDAEAAAKAAPATAALLAGELGHDEDWAQAQVGAFQALAAGYLLDRRVDASARTVTP